MLCEGLYGVKGVLVGLYIVGVLVEKVFPGCFELVAGEPVAEVVPLWCVVADGVIGVGEELFGLGKRDVFFCGIDRWESLKPDAVGIFAGYDGAVKVEGDDCGHVLRIVCIW